MSVPQTIAFLTTGAAIFFFGLWFLESRDYGWREGLRTSSVAIGGSVLIIAVVIGLAIVVQVVIP